MAKSTVIKFIVGILIIALLAGGVLAVLKFTKLGDIFKDNTNPVFCVESNGVTYTTGKDNTVMLPQNGKLKFNVKGTSSYKLKVTPNVTAETDFTYTVVGHEYLYSEEDLTGYVVSDADIYGDCFYIDCTRDNTLKGVLSRIWGGAEIVLNNQLQFPYKLTVTSDNGEDISILISPYRFSVTLTPYHVVF